jgi:hypothetical protein
MSRKTVLAGASLILVLATGLFVWPAFMMPDWLYGAVYGWRYPKVWRCGSAIVTDAGPGEATSRYTLDLGTVSLDQSSILEFQVCDLPAERFACGLEIFLSKLSQWDAEWSSTKNARVSMRLRDSTDRLVFDSAGVLGGGWTWSGPYGGSAFVYGNTIFEPHPKDTYRLTLAIAPGGAPSGLTAKIVMRGGGWK